MRKADQINRILSMWALGKSQREIMTKLELPSESVVEYALMVGRNNNDPRAALRRPSRRIGPKPPKKKRVPICIKCKQPVLPTQPSRQMGSRYAHKQCTVRTFT